MLLGFAHFGAVLTLAFAVIGAVLESAAVGRGFQFGTFGMCDAAGCGHVTSSRLCALLHEAPGCLSFQMTQKAQALYIVEIVFAALFLALLLSAKGKKARVALVIVQLLAGGAGVIPMEEHIKTQDLYNNSAPAGFKASYGNGFYIQMVSWILAFLTAALAIIAFTKAPSVSNSSTLDSPERAGAPVVLLNPSVNQDPLLQQ